MVKKLLLFTSLFFFSKMASAQLDTVLYEGFQVDPFGAMALSPSGNDAGWVDHDEDGITPNTGIEADKRWNHKQFFFMPLDSMTGEVNFCAGSYSFLENSANGNRNWLITPPITISNNTYTMHWRSAPSQLPRYMDGYLVLASTSGNLLPDFKDTLFQAASMASYTGNGQNLNLANFNFTPGYVHGNNMTLTQYFTPNGNNSIAYGKLEPHSVSLSGLAGKTVYFAFLHNSDDDDRLAIDDILVARSSTVGISASVENDLRFVSYPNPVDNFMDLMFRMKTAGAVSVQVTDVEGRERICEHFGQFSAGEQQLKLNLQSLQAGMYVLTFDCGGATVSKVFRKR